MTAEERMAFLKEEMERQQQIAQELIEESGSLLPMAVILRPDKVEVVGMAFNTDQEKFATRRWLKRQCLGVPTIGLITVMDTWMAEHPPGTDLEHVGPARLAPNRTEALVVSGFTAGGQMTTVIRYRRDGQRIIWGEPLQPPEVDPTGIKNQWNPWQMLL